AARSSLAADQRHAVSVTGSNLAAHQSITSPNAGSRWGRARARRSGTLMAAPPVKTRMRKSLFTIAQFRGLPERILAAQRRYRPSSAGVGRASALRYAVSIRQSRYSRGGNGKKGGRRYQSRALKRQAARSAGP